MHDVQIPHGYFHLLRSYLQEEHDIDLLAWTPLQQLHGQLKMVLDAPIAQQTSLQLFQHCYALTQQHLACPHLVFELAQYIKPEHFGVLGYMASLSANVAEALHYILKFSRLVIDGKDIIPMQIEQQGECVSLSWPYFNEDYIFLNELTNACMVALARQIVPHTHFPLQQVGFAHAAQLPVYHYQKFYNCALLFEQTHYSLSLGIGSLALKLEQADASLKQLLMQQAEQAIASKDQHDNVLRKLHVLVAEYLRQHQQVPKIEEVAVALHLSVRTLQRQLTDLDSAFKSVVEQERMLQCDKLLLKGVAFSEIARQLGYSDQSALARAYKRVRGETLLQQKQRLKHALS